MKVNVSLTVLEVGETRVYSSETNIADARALLDANAGMEIIGFSADCEAEVNGETRAFKQSHSQTSDPEGTVLASHLSDLRAWLDEVGG